jgi:hypothetical protein
MIQKTKKSFGRRILNGLCGLVALASSCTSASRIVEQINTRPQEPAKQEQPEQRTENSPVSVGLTTEILSRYMFRGFTYSEGSVVQLVPIVTHGNVSLIGFINHDNTSGDVNEADLTIDYTKQFGKLGLSVGYSYLTFPNTPLNETQELYLIASLDTPAKPSLKVFRDIDDIKGTYIEAILSHDFDIKGVPLSVAAMLAYNDHFLREESGFSHADLKLAAPLKLTDRLVITPNIRYSHALEKTHFEGMVYGGVSVETRF